MSNELTDDAIAAGYNWLYKNRKPMLSVSSIRDLVEVVIAADRAKQAPSDERIPQELLGAIGVYACAVADDKSDEALEAAYRIIVQRLREWKANILAAEKGKQA